MTVFGGGEKIDGTDGVLQVPPLRFPGDELRVARSAGGPQFARAG